MCRALQQHAELPSPCSVHHTAPRHITIIYSDLFKLQINKAHICQIHFVVFITYLLIIVRMILYYINIVNMAKLQRVLYRVYIIYYNIIFYKRLIQYDIIHTSSNMAWGRGLLFTAVGSFSDFGDVFFFEQNPRTQYKMY